MSTDKQANAMAFRSALGNFPTGVTVVTATGPDGARVGVTANSFNSVSLDPPLVLWSIDKASASYPVFAAASHFAVNILAADQIHLSNHFARPRADKFENIEVSTGAGGSPVLPRCAAVFECERYNCIEGGDHWILIGKVERFTDAGSAPLVYHQGSYSSIMPQGSATSSETENSVSTAAADTMGENLYYLMLQAVKHYESDYRPKQLATGLRTAEARILLSLQAHHHLDRETLSAQVNMPHEDIEQAFQELIGKDLVGENGELLHLTPGGSELAGTLWQIARDEQARKFDTFEPEDIAIFRRILSELSN